VRLYLSSFRMGNHPEHLAALVGGDGRNVVVIANALDDAPADVRRSGLERELAALADLGFDGVELDLRNYFGQEQRLRRDLAGAALAWLRGGNVFMLRYALFQLPAPARRPGSPHQWPRHQDRVVPPSAWPRLFKEPDGFRSNTAALVTA
jgi:dipeptidase E